MCMRETLVGGLALLLAGAIATAADGPELGKPVTEADLALWNISVAPDGAGLPPGSGTPAQGAVVYAAKCELCHGKEGQGGPNAALSARSRITCLTRRRFSILRGERCRGSNQNRSPTTKSTP
jgi:cytochrome c5